MKARNMITVLLATIILVSCAPAATAIPTETEISASTFTPIPIASVTITPTSIPTIDIEGQNIPDPGFSNPDFFDLEKQNSPIPQFVYALSTAGIEVSPQAIKDGLVYKAVKTKNGDTAILLLTSNLPETSYDEGDIPLFVYMRNQKTGVYDWNIAYLKDMASLHSILTGALFGGAEEFELNEKTGMFSNNFNMATISWTSVDVPIEIMDRDTEYRLSQIAKEDPQEMMWFHLGDIPLDKETFASKDEAVAYVNNEIDKITGKYGDHMTIVNVFNEVNPFSKTVWNLWKKFGDDFLIQVYQHVRETLPNAKIIYNESYNYTKSHEGTTYPYSLEIANALKGHIDAVGMEMHMAQSQWGADTPTSIDEIVEIMQSFDTPVYVTELDVNQTFLPGTEQQKNIEQARIYEMVVRSCVKSQVCEILNFWGTADPYSWYVIALGQPNSKACLFDGSGNPKLGYYGVLRGLTESLVSSTP